MTMYRPVVLINGKLSLLPSGDTLSAKIQEVDVTELQAKVAIGFAGMVVYTSAAFQVLLANSVADVSSEVLGLALAAVAVDAYVNIQTDGVLELADWTGSTGSSALVAGTDYFLDSTAGLLTATVPTTGNLTYIGRAISPQKLEISIQRPIKLT